MKGWIFSFQRQWTFKITHFSQSHNRIVSIMTKLEEGMKGNVFRDKCRIDMVGGAMWDVIHLTSIFFLWNQHCWEIFHELNSSIKLEEVVVSSCTI